LSHTSGVSGWDQPATIDDVYEWYDSTAMLAAQAPWREPGAGSGYHAMTYGHLIGDVLRRITGQRLGKFFAGDKEPYHVDRAGRVAGPRNSPHRAGAIAGAAHPTRRRRRSM